MFKVSSQDKIVLVDAKTSEQAACIGAKALGNPASVLVETSNADFEYRKYEDFCGGIVYRHTDTWAKAS